MRTIIPLAIVLSICIWQVNTSAQDQSKVGKANTSEGSTVNLGPIELGLSGVVRDDNGQPLSGATVRLLATKEQFVMPSYQTRGSISTTTASDGSYRLSFSSADPFFLAGYHTQVYMLVHAPKHELKIDWFHLNRCAVDLPKDIRLTAAKSQTMQVLASDGRPMADATIRPARFNETDIPFDEGEQWEVTTDQFGNASVQNWPSRGLRLAYLSHPSIGMQCVSVDKGWSVKAMASRSISGRMRVKADAPTQNPDWSKVELFLMTTPTAESGAGTPFAWSNCRLDNEGNFTAPHLTAGTLGIRCKLPNDMPYALDQLSLTPQEITEGNFEVFLHPATKVIGNLVVAETEIGIPNLHISNFELCGRTSISDAKGRFEFWAGPGRISYYPSDALGRFTLAEAFYISPQENPVDGLLLVKPLQLRPMSSAIATIVDPDGQPVAGAEVECSSKRERFTNTTRYWSDRNGEVRFYGLSDGETVSISASAGDLGTKRPTALKLSADARPKMALVKLPTASFSGQVVDSQGQPIAGAVVNVRKATASQEESYGGTDRSIESLFAAETFRTDNNGRFQTSPTTNFDIDVSASVSASGYETCNARWARLSSDSKNSQQLSFGTIQLRPSTASVAVRVTIADESGAALPNARVVFLGARSGLSKLRMGEPKAATLEVRDGAQIVAAIADGYQPQFRLLNQVDAEVTFKLDRKSSVSHQGTQISADALRTAANDILSLVPEPSLVSTFHKLQCYYGSLIIAKPNVVVDKIKTLKLLGLSTDLLQGVTGELVEMPPDQIQRLVPICGENMKHYLLFALAEKATPEQRENLLAEALISTRAGNGEQQLYSFARVATLLLKHDSTELAREIMREAWDGHKEMRDIIDKGERLERSQRKQGVARYFAPPLALIEPEKALRLIDATAYVDEIPRLKVEAACYMIAGKMHGWQSTLAEIDAKQTVYGTLQYCEKIGFRDAADGRALLPYMPSIPGKAKYLLHLAEKCAIETTERLEFAREALAIIRSAKPDLMSDHDSQIAASACGLVAPWDSQLAEQFAFESMWLCEEDHTILPFNLTCEIAKRLATFDQALARHLVTPCFEDWSWLFGERDHSVIYQHNRPLSAALSIDPAWATTKARELLESELSTQPSRKLETVYGMASQIRELLKKAK